jgi:hypothetical protein
MSDPQPTPTILDHAREAVRLFLKCGHMASTLPGIEWDSRGALTLHALEHYADIATALIAVHDRAAGLAQQVEELKEWQSEAEEQGACECCRCGRVLFPQQQWMNSDGDIRCRYGFGCWQDSETKASLAQPGETQEKEAAS